MLKFLHSVRLRYSMIDPKNSNMPLRLLQILITFWNRKLSSIEKRINNAKLKKTILLYQISNGYPIDQTARCGALAQIEVICRKIS